MQTDSTGYRIKSLRIRQGLSQQQLASCAGVNLRTVQRVEAGANTPYGDTLQRLAQCLNVPVQRFTEQTDMKTEQKGIYSKAVSISL